VVEEDGVTPWSNLRVRPSDVVPVRQTPQLLLLSLEGLTYESHAAATRAASPRVVHRSMGVHRRSVMPAAARVRDDVRLAGRDVIPHDVARGIGGAPGPDGPVSVHLTGRQERVPSADPRELLPIAGREIEEDEASRAVPVQAPEEEPSTGRARPVLPLLGVDATRRVAPLAGLQVEEPQTGSSLFELLIDEEIALDVSVRTVRAGGVDPDPRATVRRANEDVEVTRPLHRVLLPGDPAGPPDRLIFADPRPIEDDLRVGGDRGGSRRRKGGEGDRERRQQRWDAWKASPERGC